MRTAKALDVPASIASRFWLKVDKNGPVHPTLGTRCELWTGCRNTRGYGTIGISIGRGKSRTELTHRVASVLRDGPLKAGELVLHLFGCSSRACVLHTYRGTQKQNMIDRAATGYKPGRNPARGNAHWTKRIGMRRNLKGQNLPRSESTAAIRSQVMVRAAGRCECGCGRALDETAQMDHAFGRAKAPQSIENCWALTLRCHADKTSNRPSAHHWLEKFIRHARGLGPDYDGVAVRAENKIAVLRAKGFA